MRFLINIDNPFVDTMALLLLIPFLAFGVHALRRRFLFHDDWGLAHQSAVLLFALLTAAFEIYALRTEITDSPVHLIFSSLGMLAATMALYGHIAVSFLSKLLVDVFLPGADEVTSAPRFGPAEALERLGDYQGALNEYHVLARIFPGRPEIMARIGGALEALTSYDEAALWFQRALDAQDRPHEATTLLWRLLDLLEHRQQRPDLAAQACEALLARFPDLPDAGSVELRRKRLVDAQRPPEQPAVVPSRPALVRLDEEPIAPDSQNRKPFS